MSKTVVFLLSAIGMTMAAGCAVTAAESGDSVVAAGDAFAAPRAEVVTEARADDPLGVHALAEQVNVSIVHAPAADAASTGFTESAD